MENDRDFQDFFSFDLEVDWNLADIFSIGTSFQNLDLSVETAMNDTFTIPFQAPLIFEPLDPRFTDLEEDEPPSMPALQISNVADPARALELHTQFTDLESNANLTVSPAENAKSLGNAIVPPANVNLPSGIAVQKKRRLLPRLPNLTVLEHELIVANAGRETIYLAGAGTYDVRNAGKEIAK